MSMKKHKVVKLVVTVLIPMVFIGCDLLGLSPKKKEEKAAVSTPKALDAGSTAKTGALPKDVLVRVGNWSLTQAEFDNRLKLLKQGLPEFNENDAETKQMVLDELIRQELMVQDATNSDIANSQEIKDAVEDFRRTLLVQELAGRLTKDVVVTEADAQKYYDENKKQFAEPIKWKAREIVVQDEATAKNILVQILQGGDFAAIAQAQSKGKTAAKGGELEEFIKAPTAVMQTAIANLDAGGTSSVFKSDEGYTIVHIDSKTGGDVRPFAEIKNELISGLTLREQQKAVLDHLNKLADKYKVEINQDLIGESMKK